MIEAHFVQLKTNDSGNRTEDMTMHHVQNTAHVINIGGTGGRGVIFIVGLILLRRIDTRCILFMKIYVESYGVRKPQLCAWLVDNNIIYSYTLTPNKVAYS